MPELALAIIITVLLLIIFLPSFKKGSTDKIYIVERVGSFLKVLDEPKVYFLIPFIDRVIQTVPKGIVEKEFTFSLDEEQKKYSYLYHYEVFDIMLFVYEELNTLKSLEKHISEYVIHSKDADLSQKSSHFEYAKSLGIKLIDISKK